MEVSKNESVNHVLKANEVSGASTVSNERARSEVVVKQSDINTNSKYDRIVNLCEAIKEEQVKYEGVYKKYRKGNRICTGLAIGSNFLATASGSSALATSLTGIGLPAAIPLGFISGVAYVTSILTVCINKKIESKMRKHKAIVTLARSKCITLDKTIVKVLDDNVISVDEYEVLCRIVEEYLNQKNELRKRKVDIKKVFDEAENAIKEKLM